MMMSIANVVLHIDRALGPAEINVVGDHVWEDPCVVGARVSPSASHLMLVAFDPDCTSAGRIQDNVTRHGVDAQVIVP